MGDGVLGERAPEHAIQMEDNAQGSIRETYHAQQPQLIPAPVNVSEKKFYVEIDVSECPDSCVQMKGHGLLGAVGGLVLEHAILLRGND